MTLYWPSAKFRDSTGNITKISTSNGTFSLEEAQNQLNIWRDNYGMAVTDFGLMFIAVTDVIGLKGRMMPNEICRRKCSAI